VPSRFYLGFAYAARRDNDRALAVWKSLLAEVPANVPLHGVLLDRIAQLSAQQGEGPDIGAMVAGLAARLKSQPDDPEGWQRLVRAYAVLGDRTKALAAFKDASAAMKANPQALSALDDEARQLGLMK
jgi:cytochrome c-type biogenesis protein CcmH